MTVSSLLRRTSVALASFGMLLATPAISRADIRGFCTTYSQTTSNAGDCPHCKLVLSHGRKHDTIVITANNGWSAEVDIQPNRRGLASGGGRWRAGTRSTYAGRHFDIDVIRRGRELGIAMWVNDRTAVREIVATFRCTAMHERPTL